MSYSNRFSFFLKIKSITQHKSSSFTKKIVGCFFVGVAIIILCIPVINARFQLIENFFDDKLSGVYQTTAAINSDIKKFRENFFSLFSLIKENTELRNENEKLKVATNQLALISLENKKLKLINNFVFPKTRRILSTRLLFRTDGQVGLAKILAGKMDGVKDGQFIVTNSGALLGKIIRVSNKTAKVLLINEPQSKISVAFPKINNRAILSGNYNENLKILFTKIPMMPTNGDIVITSGDDSLPPGLLVGTVVKNKNKEPIVVPTANPRNIDFVSVLEFEGSENNL